MTEKKPTDEEQKKRKEEFVKFFLESECYLCACTHDEEPDATRGRLHLLANISQGEFLQLMLLFEEKFPEAMKKYVTALVLKNYEAFEAMLEARNSFGKDSNKGRFNA